jgi:uncharacterized protein
MRTTIEAGVDAGAFSPHAPGSREYVAIERGTLRLTIDGEVFHGSPASRMLQALEQGVSACVTVTHVDGLVLARSAFHHSMNYRSVVVVGTAVLVDELEKKREVLHALTDHLVCGRWEAIRRPSPQELKKTLMLAIPIQEASAKIRTGPPLDEEEEYPLSMWAGVVPLTLTAGEPVADPSVLGHK